MIIVLRTNKTTLGEDMSYFQLLYLLATPRRMENPFTS